MATHSSILAWRIPGTEGPGVTVHWVAKSWTRLSVHPYVYIHIYIAQLSYTCI